MILASNPEGLVISWQMSQGRTVKCAANEPGSHKYKTSVDSYGGNRVPVTFFLKLAKTAELKKTRKWQIISCNIVGVELQFVMAPREKSAPVDISRIVPRLPAEGGEVVITFKSSAEVQEPKSRRQPRRSVFETAQTAFAG